MEEAKILVIDSEESSCELLRAILVSRGFQVWALQASQPALEVLTREQIQLVFVDMSLRDIDARYLISELKRRDLSLGIILLSYPQEHNLIQEASTMKASDYLYKPLKSDEVYFKVNLALQLRRAVLSSAKMFHGIEERNINLQKQNLMLAKRIEESTRNLTRLYEDLRETYMRTIKALAHAIDARDHYTFSHSDHVTRLAEAIAIEMKVDQRYVEEIKDACQLHDLGKIGVHDNVLGKPGALTAEEFNEIKLHALKGAQILEPLRFMDKVIDIVKHHHERWDGKGYPDGLKGEDIPLGSRIMAVADSYDAMVSARPYRQVGLSQREALDEIQKNSRAQFDPKVVEAFLGIVSKL